MKTTITADQGVLYVAMIDSVLEWIDKEYSFYYNYNKPYFNIMKRLWEDKSWWFKSWTDSDYVDDIKCRDEQMNYNGLCYALSGEKYHWERPRFYAIEIVEGLGKAIEVQDAIQLHFKLKELREKLNACAAVGNPIELSSDEAQFMYDNIPDLETDYYDAS